jgi:outer membrane lipopolysaccharide assembly protein LptE/RlpB
MKTTMKTGFQIFSYLTLTVFLFLGLSGCGYTFQGSGSVLPPDVKRIYIPLVDNNTTESGLSTLLTEAFRDRFERYGVVEVVDEMGGADAVLRARILKVKRDTGAVTSQTDTALRVDTTMTVAVELRRVTGPLLWRNSNLSVMRQYAASAAGVVTGSAAFAGGNLGVADLNSLSTTGSREVARGQEDEAFAYLTERAAQLVYDSAVAPDF